MNKVKEDRIVKNEVFIESVQKTVKKAFKNGFSGELKMESPFENSLILIDKQPERDNFSISIPIPSELVGKVKNIYVVLTSFNK